MGPLEAELSELCSACRLVDMCKKKIFLPKGVLEFSD